MSPVPPVPTISYIFKQTTIIYLALAVGILFFGIAVLLLRLSGMVISSFVYSQSFLLAVPVVIVSVIGSAHLLYHIRTKGITAMEEPARRLHAYQQAVVIRLALYEAVALFSLGIYLLTGQMLMILLFVLLFAVFVRLRPREDEIRRWAGE